MMKLSLRALAEKLRQGPPKAPRADRTGRRALMRELYSRWLIIPNPKRTVRSVAATVRGDEPTTEVVGGRVLRSEEIRATFARLRFHRFPDQRANVIETVKREVAQGRRAA